VVDWEEMEWVWGDVRLWSGCVQAHFGLVLLVSGDPALGPFPGEVHSRFFSLILIYIIRYIYYMRYIYYIYVYS
jgi:hypothetical protein